MGALVVNEAVFGVDGDCVDICEILSAMRSEDVLFIDEAHALGVVGSHGRGIAFGLADPRILVMGMLSKASGTLGGFVAGPRRAIAYLQSVARTFIFDTALPPAVAEAARVAFRLARDRDAERAKIVVEGLGGAAVPLNATETIAHLAATARLTSIVVVGLKLGCINHASLTVHYLHALGCEVAGFVLVERCPGVGRDYRDEVACRLSEQLSVLGTLRHDLTPTGIASAADTLSDAVSALYATIPARR